MGRTYNTMSDPAYEPLVDQVEDEPTGAEQPRTWKRFSRFEYGIFFLLGVAMLWAWNMFLAAAPYFHDRFASSKWTATHYQSSILTVSTITNLAAAYTLAKVQKNVSYPWRVTVSLLMNCVIFTLLAFSTVLLKDISVRGYFGFLLVMVFGASLATGINQNGVFAFAAGFGRDEYTQAIMGGQGLAGVLPCIAQIVSVLVVPRGDSNEHGTPASSPTSAFIYFLTATVVSVFTLLAFLYLLRTRPDMRHRSADSEEDENLVDHDHGHSHNKPVGLWTLFKKLKYLALGVFLCFTITMMAFPVYTGEIMSVNDPQKSRLYDAPVFVPLAFLFWNVGDLAGRLAVAIPRLSLANRPWLAFVLSISRAGFIPLYLFCNVNAKGAVISSDFFYLFVVQLLFGVTNGYLASSCMMGAGHWVAVHEREAAGGFMNMMLVGGLAAGSVLSFIVAS